VVSVISSRTNYYEALGLSASASSEEIGRAFAREFGSFRPRALGDVALVSVAFETLRDPAKRRAYDESLALKAEPQPRPAPTVWRDWTQLIGAAPVRPVEPSVRRELPPAEPKTASFIAASLRAEPEQARQPAPQPQPQRRPEVEATPRISADRLLRHAEQLRLSEAEDRPVEWRRTALIIGGPIVAVAVIGALAGWQAGHSEGAQAEAAVTTALPPAKPYRAAVSKPPAAEPKTDETQFVRPARAAITERTRRPVIEPQMAAPEVALSEASQPSQPDTQSGDPLAAQPAAAETATALPLSNAIIARTIGRIGYACGKVASSSPVAGGAPGAYTVTCTSGQSYQATPIHGRYHFRRLGRP
jgi:hypothetical protein